VKNGAFAVETDPNTRAVAFRYVGSERTKEAFDVTPFYRSADRIAKYRGKRSALFLVLRCLPQEKGGCQKMRTATPLECAV